MFSQGLTGGTTVSATMIAAHRAGIPVFVTGGIGVVHRDGENSLDISADLTELGRTPITVNVSGAGDSLAGALMAGILRRRDTDSCVRMGLLAARLSLASPHPFDPTLSFDSVDLNKVH